MTRTFGTDNLGLTNAQIEPIILFALGLELGISLRTITPDTETTKHIYTHRVHVHKSQREH